MEKIKEIIRKKLAEMSATGMGGASFSPGEGMNYATPKAFKKTKNLKEGPGATLGPGPKAGPEGVKDNIYVKDFKYKLVNQKALNQKAKGIEVKSLWEANTDVDSFLQDIDTNNPDNKKFIANLNKLTPLENVHDFIDPKAALKTAYQKKK